MDLVKCYISLYEGTFLMKSINKYSGKKTKLKTSSPKLIPMCPVRYLVVQSPYRTDEKRKEFLKKLLEPSLEGYPLSYTTGDRAS